MPFPLHDVTARSVAAAGYRELARNRCEDDLDLVSKANQNRNRDNRDKGENQGILHEGLTSGVAFSPGCTIVLKHSSYYQTQPARLLGLA
jgi:hypothetical protein